MHILESKLIERNRIEWRLYRPDKRGNSKHHTESKTLFAIPQTWSGLKKSGVLTCVNLARWLFGLSMLIYVCFKCTPTPKLIQKRVNSWHWPPIIKYFRLKPDFFNRNKLKESRLKFCTLEKANLLILHILVIQKAKLKEKKRIRVPGLWWYSSF